jgi:DNA-binding transcriptional MerR regulator
VTPQDERPGKTTQRLTIGEFARRSFLSPKALRLYDRQGLLVPAEVDPHSGYRFYREEQLATARLISRLRQLDMPLAIVQSLVQRDPHQQADLLAAWWDDVEARIDAQRELMTWLLISLSGREMPTDRFVVEERAVPATTVICEQRHVNAFELPGWLETRMAYLIDLAHQHGGVGDRCFVIYHGEISDDSNGPAEICVPIHPDRAENLNAPTRVDPAHHEAFTRLRKRQVAYPQILTGYDAVEQWTVHNQRIISGPPREIYDPGFPQASPDDFAVDIAFPIASTEASRTRS